MLTRLLLLLTLWMGSLTVSAQDADSINQAAQHPEFIHVYLVTIGPGNDAVSAYGHAAIRLQCESKQLDYCFSFNMSDTGLAPLKFVAGTAKAGFQAVPTDRFVEQYRQEGRAVSEYQLNLLPLEEQQLWRLLDEEIMKGAYWKYDFITVNCTSMCVWIVQRALTGERLFCRNMPPALSRPYKELLHEISAHSPWMELFFNIRLFSRRNDIGTPDAKMVPDVLAAVWSDSQIEDSAGNQRPMIVGSRTICQQTVALTSPLVTPCMAAWMVVVVVLAAGGMLWHKRKRNV